MKRVLRLDRPLAVFDLETTGRWEDIDRIVEIGILKVHPDGTKKKYTERINPEMPIPPEASKVHKIYDSDVKDRPTFRQIAQSISKILKGCDLGGFNVSKFDLHILQKEFVRAGVKFSLKGRAIVDVMRVFHLKESRDLPAAARFYLNSEHDDAHSALADARMTFRVLEAQLRRYRDLPREPSGLHEFCKKANESYLDSERKFEWRYRQAAFAFGKHRGKLLRDVKENDAKYLDWMLTQDFPPDTMKIVRNALKGEFPKCAERGEKL